MLQLENTDSGGFDLGKIEGKSVKEMENICQSIPYAVAFNSNGWVKYRVNSTKSTWSGVTLYILSKQFKQLSTNTLPPIWCINLKRRPDRKNSMLEKGIPLNFFEAVDGSQLTMNEELSTIFQGNDFGFRRGVIGAALSHCTLWRELLASQDSARLIVEDDVEFSKDFMAKYSHTVAQMNLIDPNWDFLYLGFSLYNRKQYEADLWNDDLPLVTPFDNKLCFGAGFFGYVISRSGAQKMLEYIKINGIKRAIDCIPPVLPNVKRYSCIPNIIQTPCFGPGMENVDTDIQKDFTTL